MKLSNLFASITGLTNIGSGGGSGVGRSLADNNNNNNNNNYSFQAKYGFLTNYMQTPQMCSNEATIYGQSTETSVMIYRLCPVDGNCNNGYGEYMVKLSDYARLAYKNGMIPQQEVAEDDDANDDGGRKQRKLEDYFNPYEYIECNPFLYIDEYENENWYFVGPSCSSGIVTLDIFTDNACSIPLGSESLSLSSITGYSAPSKGLISFDSADCSSGSNFCINTYNSQYIRKCETNMAYVSDYLGRIEGGCGDIQATVKASSSSGGGSGIFANNSNIQAIFNDDLFYYGVAVLVGVLLLCGVSLYCCFCARSSQQEMEAEMSIVSPRPLV